MDLYDIENILLRLEKKIDELEKRLVLPVVRIKDWKDIPEDCMNKNFKPNVPVGISCPCPQCSPYAPSYLQTTNGDPTKFRSGSISSNDGYNINDPIEGNQRPSIPPKAPPEVKR